MNERMGQERFLQMRHFLNYPETNPFFEGSTEDIQRACEGLILLPMNSGEEIAEFHRVQAIDWLNQLQCLGSEEQVKRAVEAVGIWAMGHTVKGVYDDLEAEDHQSGDYFNIVRAYENYGLSECEPEMMPPRAAVGVFATLLDIYDEPAYYHYLTAKSIQE